MNFRDARGAPLGFFLSILYNLTLLQPILQTNKLYNLQKHPVTSPESASPQASVQGIMLRHAQATTPPNHRDTSQWKVDKKSLT